MCGLLEYWGCVTRSWDSADFLILLPGTSRPTMYVYDDLAYRSDGNTMTFLGINLEAIWIELFLKMTWFAEADHFLLSYCYHTVHMLFDRWQLASYMYILIISQISEQQTHSALLNVMSARCFSDMCKGPQGSEMVVSTKTA